MDSCHQQTVTSEDSALPALVIESATAADANPRRSSLLRIHIDGRIWARGTKTDLK